MQKKVLSVAEKPSIAREISRILSNGQSQKVCSALLFAFRRRRIEKNFPFLQRNGISQYNHCFDFVCTVGNVTYDMVVTSVTGHLTEVNFPNAYRGWRTTDPVSLFQAPIEKIVPAVTPPSLPPFFRLSSSTPPIRC